MRFLCFALEAGRNAFPEQREVFVCGESVSGRRVGLIEPKRLNMERAMGIEHYALIDNT